MIIGDAIKVLKAGEKLKNPATWKKGQVLTDTVGGLVMGTVALKGGCMSNRNWTDEDLEALAKVLDGRPGHACRFDNISVEDLKESVTFYKNFNTAYSEGKTVARKTLVALTVVGVVGMTIAGFFTKIKDGVKLP